MFSKKLIVLALALYCFVPIVSLHAETSDPGRFNFTSGQTKVEIPFYTFNNQVVLSVWVNDKVPLNFILDTGTRQVLIFDRKLAKDLGIGFGRKIQFSGIGNNHVVNAFRGRGVKLSLPGIEGDMMGAAVLSSDYMDMKRFDIHGIIGYQLFFRFAVKIDYHNRVLTLMEPNNYNAAGYHALDMQIENSKPFIHSRMKLENEEEVQLKLMIDTGAAYGLFLITGTHPAIRVPKNSQKMRLGSGLGGELKGFKGKSTLKLNTELISEITTFYVRPRDFSKKGNELGRMGSIGSDLLNDYVVIIDYVNSKMLIQVPTEATYINKPSLYQKRTAINTYRLSQ
ncbi:MAG: retropepsin-like aspartic protease [Aurantibacter sp.]